MVQVTADNTDIESKPREYFDDFDVIVATGCSSRTIVSSQILTLWSSVVVIWKLHVSVGLIKLVNINI